VFTVITLLMAALATSRATAHVLSATALALIVAGAAAASVAVAWGNGLYNGAADVLKGEAVLDCRPGCHAEPDKDPWAPKELWRTTLLWTLLVAVWAGAGGALVAVALNGKQARLLVVFVALAGLAGVAHVVVDAVARHRGAHATRRPLDPDEPVVGIRRRAWLQVALPLAIAQLLVNAGMAWVLFHDYATHVPRADVGVGLGTAAAAGKVLTRSVALADVLVIVTILAVIFGSLASMWGATDVGLGRVVTDDPETQTTTSKSNIGAQGIVYVALLGLVLGKVVTWLLPSSPSLLDVVVARAVFAGVLAFLAAGAGYVRGAVNAPQGATATDEAAVVSIPVEA
jgi:hypothetical protein